MKKLFTLLAALALLGNVVNGQTTLNCYNYGDPVQNEHAAIRYELNGIIQEYNGFGNTPAIHVVVIDSIICQPWGTFYGTANPNHQFGNMNNNGGLRDRVELYFIFQQNSPSQLDGLRDMLNNSIPDGAYLLVYSWIYLDVDSWDNSLFTAFQNLGTTVLNPTTDSVPYIFFVQKGFPSNAVEVLGTNQDDFIQLNDVLNCVYVGLSEEKPNSKLSIYPNPTEGKFEVRSLELGVEKVAVFDLFGRLVLSSIEPQIDMRGYAKGVYVVKAGQAVRKLVIE